MRPHHHGRNARLQWDTDRGRSLVTGYIKQMAHSADVDRAGREGSSDCAVDGLRTESVEQVVQLPHDRAEGRAGEAGLDEEFLGARGRGSQAVLAAVRIPPTPCILWARA